MASKRAQRRRSCERKQSYPTADAALIALRRIPTAQSYTRPIAFYHCSYCAKYHIGHMTREAVGRTDRFRQEG